VILLKMEKHDGQWSIALNKSYGCRYNEEQQAERNGVLSLREAETLGLFASTG
jgi:hypothetical protein